jgi:hypothetical protein
VSYKQDMVKKTRFLSRLLIFLIFIATCGITAFGLTWLNEAMEVRYQAIGIITDGNHMPIEGVKALLFLSPPPTSTRLDTLFHHKTIADGRETKDEQIKQATGPVLGLSGPKGVFLVRATGRPGAVRAIRMGLDSGGRPPFEIAWLVLRKDGYQDSVTTLSIMNWRTAPKRWGKVANRLPELVMNKNSEK